MQNVIGELPYYNTLTLFSLFNSRGKWLVLMYQDVALKLASNFNYAMEISLVLPHTTVGLYTILSPIALNSLEVLLNSTSYYHVISINSKSLSSPRLVLTQKKAWWGGRWIRKIWVPILGSIGSPHLDL